MDLFERLSPSTLPQVLGLTVHDSYGLWRAPKPRLRGQRLWVTNPVALYHTLAPARLCGGGGNHSISSHLAQESQEHL